MSIAWASGVFLGTDETTGVTVTNNTTSTGSEIDLLGGTTAEGWLALVSLKYTGTAAAGSVSAYLYPSRVSGQSYQDQPIAFQSIVPANATQKIELGSGVVKGRYVTGAVQNNAVGASLTNVTLGYQQQTRS